MAVLVSFSAVGLTGSAHELALRAAAAGGWKMPTNVAGLGRQLVAVFLLLDDRKMPMNVAGQAASSCGFCDG